MNEILKQYKEIKRVLQKHVKIMKKKASNIKK